MHRIVLTAMLLAPTALLPAQIDAAGTKPKSAEAAYQALTEKYSAAQAEYRQLTTAARQAGETIELDPPAAAFVPRFQEEAEAYAGTGAAVPFLSWIVLNAGGDSAAANAALDTLVSDHIASEGWVTLAPRLPSLARVVGEERVAEVTETLLAENKQPEVLSQILFARANEVFRTVSRGREEVSEEQKQAAMADMNKVLELTSDEQLRTRAKGAVFEATRLQVGMVAPDIVAEDLDGVTFKLSDYRGKVVLLDFWGDW